MATETKKYYWLKLNKDFFKSKRIKKLRKLAGGDTFTIIYLKMQLLALTTNGVLEYTGLEKTFAEELALDIDEDVDNTSVTINYLLSCGLLETNDNIEYLLPYVVENTGNECTSAERVRKHRERQKLLQCNTYVTKCNTEKEIEKDIELEIEKEKEIKTEIKEKIYKRENVEEIIDYLNLCAGTNYRYNGKETVKHITARLKEGFSVEDFKIVIDKKVKEWKGTNMEQYLRPTTLFAPSKFESYLNQTSISKSTGSAYIDAIRDRIDVVDSW